MVDEEAIANTQQVLAVPAQKAEPFNLLTSNYFLNIDPPIKNYSKSKGKSNTCAKEIFHNLILHTHFLLHLHIIPFVSYYISLINKA